MKWQCLFALMFSLVTARVAAVKIGIVGGGIGGASAALYLRRLFGDDANIQLYEMERLGGRLALEELDGYRYEAGGSVIHTKNKCMLDLIETLGLQTKPAMGGTFGLWDGRQIVFASSSWSAVTSAKLLWRYGYDVLRLRRLLAATLAKFDGIYDLLDSGAAYDTVEDLIMAMDPSLVKLTGLPLSQYLKLSGFQEGFISELVTAVTLNNYGQRPHGLHALVGLVGLAGAGDELVSVLGGNHQVAERAVQQSAATLHRERVLTVEFTGEAFLVTSAAGGSAGQQTRPFDVVVVAAPQTDDQPSRLQWVGLPAPPQFPGTYHDLSVTLVAAQVRADAFSASAVPVDVFCTSGCSSEFNSLGSPSPANESSAAPGVAVHKLFSNAAPGEDLLKRLFENSERQRRSVSWKAYPDYNPRLGPAGLGNFTLINNLYYLSSVEQAASAMEMSAMAARNVANMAYTRWHNRAPPDLRRVEHTEL